MSNTLTVPTPPSTADIASRIMCMMAAQTGQITDTTPGGLMRTWSESIGSTVEVNAVELQAMAFQAIIFGGYSAFDVTAFPASPSFVILTFSTSPGTSAVTNIDIPSNTVCQTPGGTQFSTVSNTTLLANTSSVTALAQAIILGVAGNVPASAVVQIITPLQYPLYVINLASATGGTAAETPQQTASRFANITAALQLSSPQAVAAAALGVANGTEEVLYSTCYEPWTQQGAGPYTVGFTVYVDNGAGTASSTLLTNVTNKLNGDLVNFTISGYRPAGVPFSVAAVGPVDVNVTVTAVHQGVANPANIQQQITSAVQGYFSSLNFGTSAQITQLSTQVSNSVVNQVSALNIQLLVGSSPQQAVSAPATGRIILQTLTVTVT